MAESCREIVPLHLEPPFSNAWMALKTASQVPSGSTLHLGILNTLRTWNCFEVLTAVRTFTNVGGFGIDGFVSTLIGASLVDPVRLYFGVLEDLAFFYDMNALDITEGFSSEKVH